MKIAVFKHFLTLWQIPREQCVVKEIPVFSIIFIVIISTIFIGNTVAETNTLLGEHTVETLLVSLGYYISVNNTNRYYKQEGK